MDENTWKEIEQYHRAVVLIQALLGELKTIKHIESLMQIRQDLEDGVKITRFRVIREGELNEPNTGDNTEGMT